MRKQFVASVTKLLADDPACVLLLGDIGVHGFKSAKESFPDRVHNIGILEQATVGMAAGLAMTGLRPIVHTIAPFLVERAYEQLKIDFGYQGLSGTFVSVGGSHDYSSLGCTHHCPGDVNLIENIPGMGIFVPGHPDELEMYFRITHENGWRGSSYIRLAEKCNSRPVAESIIKPTVVQHGDAYHPTVVAVGPCLDMVLEAVGDLPVTVVYTMAVRPFPSHEFQFTHCNNTVVVVEPYYSSQLAPRIAASNSSRYRRINARSFSLPRQFIEEYGDQGKISLNTGFYARNLRLELEQWIESPKLSDMTPRA